MYYTAQDVNRFWSKVRKTDGCWFWTGRTNEKGYGYFDVQTGAVRAHKFAWVINFGNVPDDKEVLHSCDVRNCVRLGHLSIGTHYKNMQDAKARNRIAKGEYSGSRQHPEKLARGAKNGRHTHPERTARGERSGRAKLTDKQVLEIRATYRNNPTELSRLYGVSRTQIYLIVTNRSRCAVRLE